MASLTSLIDTSVLLRSPRHGEEVLPDRWGASIVTVGELEAGVLMATQAPVRAERLRHLSAVLAEAPVLGVDRAVSARYAELRAASGRRPSNDLWIAATALAHDLTLVTADERLAALPLVRTTLLA